MLKLFNPSKTLSNRRGMTLIEILIVMGLIAGLMTMLVSKIFPMISKADRRQSEIQMRTVMQAIELYRSDCQHYPPQDVGLGALLTKPTDCKNWGPEPYVKSDHDLKDAWGNDFIYENNNSTFILKSLGKDGVEGGTGISEDFTSDNLQ